MNALKKYPVTFLKKTVVFFAPPFNPSQTVTQTFSKVESETLILIVKFCPSSKGCVELTIKFSSSV